MTPSHEHAEQRHRMATGADAWPPGWVEGANRPRVRQPLGAVARMSRRGRPWHRVAIAASLALLAGLVRADSHALLMWIGNYAEPSAKLQGIHQDAVLARDMARRMGVPRHRVTELSDAALDFPALRAALARLRTNLRSGDTLFVYFSGHGKRLARTTQPGCQEGLVTVDGRIYFDVLLQDELEALASSAGRVVVFNDSCHSGGMAIKSFSVDPNADADAFQPKAYPAEPAPTAKAAADEAACARAVNVAAKSFGAPGTLPTDKLFYLAASAADEVAWATPQGSLATRAWHACMVDEATDTNRDGQISGHELATCASRWIRQTAPRYSQTVTPLHNDRLPLLRTGTR